MEVTIPRREHMHRTDAADPFHWYYTWGAKSFFWHRLKMAVAMFSSSPYTKMLDIGVGCGIFLPELAQHCAELHGLDIHPNLHLVDDMLQKEGIQATLTHGSITALPYPDKHFDAIVCMSVLEHLHELDAAIGEIRRVATDDASIFFGFPVENPMTRIALQIAYIWLPGAKLDDEHVSTHKDILRTIPKHLEIVQAQHFPAIVPLDWSLYYACQCRVKL
jgi:2-polyprenyl-3-methyl-5-hydroxy-6-metoxy-1,4-benzoquinol methylase